MTATVVISARVHPSLRGDLDRKARRLGFDRNTALVQAVQNWTDDPRSEAERARTPTWPICRPPMKTCAEDCMDNRPLLPELDGDERAKYPDWPWLTVDQTIVIAGLVEALIDTQEAQA